MVDKTKNPIERRKHIRYPVRGGVYATLHPTHEMLGPVINVSEGGLAFHYYPAFEEIRGVGKTRETAELSIFSTTFGFIMDGIRIKIVSDVESNKRQPGSQMKRRCGIQFMHKDGVEKVKLDNLIQTIKRT